MQDCAETPIGEYSSHLFHGDCLKSLACLPDQSIDCIITDPYYSLRTKSHTRSLLPIQIAKSEEAYSLFDKALEAAWHKLKENSHIYVFTNWQEFTSVAGMVKKYFNLKNALVWVKDHPVQSAHKGNYGHQYEVILYAHKGRRYLSGKRDANILYFNTVPPIPMQHPAEKPIALVEYLITKSTGEGEIVLDMFMGDGTTCVAAQRTNRRYIGIEPEPAWHALASHRLKGLVA